MIIDLPVEENQEFSHLLFIHSKLKPDINLTINTTKSHKKNNSVFIYTKY